MPATYSAASKSGETLACPRIERPQGRATEGTSDGRDERRKGRATEATAATPPVRSRTTGTTATPRTAVAAWRDRRDKATARRRFGPLSRAVPGVPVVASVAARPGAVAIVPSVARPSVVSVLCPCRPCRFGPCPPCRSCRRPPLHRRTPMPTFLNPRVHSYPPPVDNPPPRVAPISTAGVRPYPVAFMRANCFPMAIQGHVCRCGRVVRGRRHASGWVRVEGMELGHEKKVLSAS